MQNILKFLTGIVPREYQEKIFQTCSQKNCLVILPTGMGKTLVALMLSIDRFNKFPDEKILFLAPTRPLAEQHMNYFKKYLPELFGQMELFTGKTPAEKRQELWQNADLIFSTPQCIGNDIKNNLYSLENVSLLIEDECHRCIKNYSYTYVCQKYKEQARNQRILGLTASPGSDKATVDQICKNLDIEAVEIRTRDSGDVKEYLQDLEFNTIKLDFPEEFSKMREFIQKMLSRKIDELRNRNLLFGPATKKNLLELQRRLIRSISSGNKNFNNLLGTSACAQALKIQHALELLETQTLYSLECYLKSLMDKAEAKESRAVEKLVKQKEFIQARTLLTDLKARGIEHPKLAKLLELVNERRNKKILVFSQYRDTVTKICKEINKLGINSKVFVGQAIKDGFGLTQKEQQSLLQEFALGTIRVLVATSIGEEGLDIPEVGTVIFYEPVPSAIRKIQRAGRTARLSKGELIILLTKKTRDESYHWAAFHKEKRMHSIVNSLKNRLFLKQPKETKPASLDDFKKNV
jgi:Fanconi anemia group M protein